METNFLKESESKAPIGTVPMIHTPTKKLPYLMAAFGVFVGIVVKVFFNAMTASVLPTPFLSPTPVNNVIFPDLVIRNSDSFGGLGRLIYDPAKKQYAPVDFNFTSLVVDGKIIRPMGIKEGGGTMATPSAIRSLNGAIFALIPSYDTLLKLGSDLSVLKQKTYGTFVYGGSLEKHLETNNGNLFFFKTVNGQADTLVAYDEELNETGQLVFSSKTDPWVNFNEFTIANNKLYIFEGVDTGPYTDCVVAPHRCGERFDRVVIADISVPSKMHIEKFDKVADENPPTDVAFVGVDTKAQEWLLVNGFGAGQTIQLRKMNDVAKVVSSKTGTLSEQIFGLTKTAPFYAVITKNKKLYFAKISTEGGKVEIDKGLDLGVPDDYAAPALMKQQGNRIFITLGVAAGLRIVDVTGEPVLSFSQDFRDSKGNQFSIADFDIGDRLTPVVPGKIDKQKLTDLLSLSYYGDTETRQLQSEISKLTTADTWAIPILTATLKKQGGMSYMVSPIAVKGLGNIGPAAHTAIPEILDSTMSGFGVLVDHIAPVALAIQKIDPEGKYLIPELPMFEKRNDESGARSVSRHVLLKLSGPAVEAVLKTYR